MSQRKCSITPATFKFFIPINVEEAQAQAETRETAKSSALLKQKLLGFRQAAAASTRDVQTAIDGVFDKSRLARSVKEFSEFDTEFGAKVTRLDTYARLVGDYEKFLARNKGLELYCKEQYANSTSTIHRFGINTDPLQPAQSQELAGIFDRTVAVKAGSVSSAASDKIVLAIRTHLELECPCDKYSDHLMALEAIHKSNIGLVGQMMEDAVA